MSSISAFDKIQINWFDQCIWQNQIDEFDQCILQNSNRLVREIYFSKFKFIASISELKIFKSISPISVFTKFTSIQSVYQNQIDCFDQCIWQYQIGWFEIHTWHPESCDFAGERQSFPRETFATFFRTQFFLEGLGGCVQKQDVEMG